jgi:hypothetical protein
MRIVRQMLQGAQDRHGTIAERDPMLAAALYPRSRDRPDPIVFNNLPEHRMPVDRLADTVREPATQAFRQHSTEGLQNAAYAILQCRDLRHDLGARYQQCTHGLAVETFHRHLTVPANAHDLRQTESVVGVGFIDL